MHFGLRRKLRYDGSFKDGRGEGAGRRAAAGEGGGVGIRQVIWRLTLHWLWIHARSSFAKDAGNDSSVGPSARVAEFSEVER